MKRTTTLILLLSASMLVISSCGKQGTEELTESFEYQFDNDEGKAITTMRQLGFDDQGIPGNPEPRPFCFNTGGNCVCDVVTTDPVIQNLTALDQAIERDLQDTFFETNEYAQVFNLNPDEDLWKIQKKLRTGKLQFRKVELSGDTWYFAAKPQHVSLPVKRFMEKAVLSVPVGPITAPGHGPHTGGGNDDHNG